MSNRKLKTLLAKFLDNYIFALCFMTHMSRIYGDNWFETFTHSEISLKRLMLNYEHFLKINNSSALVRYCEENYNDFHILLNLIKKHYGKTTKKE